VREVDQLDYSVQHRVAQRDDRVNAAERQAIDDLMHKDVHAWLSRPSWLIVGRRLALDSRQAHGPGLSKSLTQIPRDP
jgi:hypothetical protein